MQRTSTSLANGFCNRQSAPPPSAFAGSADSDHAGIMMTGASKRLRPWGRITSTLGNRGSRISVTTRAGLKNSRAVSNSSTKPNSLALHPDVRRKVINATRRDVSSSTMQTELKSCTSPGLSNREAVLAELRPVPRRTTNLPVLGIARLTTPGHYTKVYGRLLCCKTGAPKPWQKRATLTGLARRRLKSRGCCARSLRSGRR